MECIPRDFLQLLDNWTASECINATWFSFFLSLGAWRARNLFEIDLKTKARRISWPLSHRQDAHPRQYRLKTGFGEYLSFRLKGFLLVGLLIIPDYNEFILGEFFSLLQARKQVRTTIERGRRESPSCFSKESQEVENNQTCLNILCTTVVVVVLRERRERFTHQFLASTKLVMKINDW